MLARRVVEDVASLPCLDAADYIFLDFETASGNPEAAEADPWFGAKIALIAISDGKTIWTIATERCARGPHRLPWEPVRTWLGDVVSKRRRAYVNQWIRVEANLLEAEGIPLNRESEWFDIEIAAHHVLETLDAYDLTTIAETFIDYHDGTLYYDAVQRWLKDAKLKDYAQVPTDLLSKYAACDVEACVLLFDYYRTHIMPDQLRALTIDLRVLKILQHMQYRGVRVNLQNVGVAAFYCSIELVELGSSLAYLLGREINPLSSDQVGELITKEFNLPVLRWNDDDGKVPTPSFDDDTLQLYLNLPTVQQLPHLHGAIAVIDQYRDRAKILGYLKQYLKLAVNGRLHSTIHPCRAHGGRTTSSHPNMQQLPPVLKTLIEADPGYGLFNVDASQIEYRWMTHYMKDPKLIKGYSTSRSFDLHKFVQDWLKIDRRAAKMINFGVGFNMGAKKMARELTALKGGQITIEQAHEILQRYFNEIVPFLIPTRRDVETTAKARGWIRNFFGRRSHLTHRYAYRGFNRVVQGSAADMVKDRMIAVDAVTGSAEWMLMVHDELLLQAPSEAPIPEIMDALEGFHEARVPMIWEGAWVPATQGPVTWADVATVKDDKFAPTAQMGNHKIKVPRT